MTSRPLTGLVVVLSGDIGELTRKEAEDSVESLGGILGKSVTAKTSLLVAGARSGTKSRAAKEKGIPIMLAEHYLVLKDAPERSELVDQALKGELGPAEEEVPAEEEGPRRERSRDPHRSYYSTGNPEGVWTVWMYCFCKEWTMKCHSVKEARAAHTEHRKKEGLGPEVLS